VLLLLTAAGAAGLFGSLLGLGGGVLAVPMLVLLFQLDFHTVVAAASIGSVATSTGSAAAYLRSGAANLRLALLLAIATTGGASVGALVSVHADVRLLSGIFALVLLYAGLSLARNVERPPTMRDEPVIVTDSATVPVDVLTRVPSGRWDLCGRYLDIRSGSLVTYEPHRLRLGTVISLGSGLLSGLLGVGGGVVNVPLLHVTMELPLRAAIATSVLIVGCTSSAAGLVQVMHGNMNPTLAAPVALGMLLGGRSGARIAPYVSQGLLRWLFIAVLGVTCIQMVLKALAIPLPWEQP